MKVTVVVYKHPDMGWVLDRTEPPGWAHRIGITDHYLGIPGATVDLDTGELVEFMLRNETPPPTASA